MKIFFIKIQNLQSIFSSNTKIIDTSTRNDPISEKRYIRHKINISRHVGYIKIIQYIFMKRFTDPIRNLYTHTRRISKKSNKSDWIVACPEITVPLLWRFYVWDVHFKNVRHSRREISSRDDRVFMDNGETVTAPWIIPFERVKVWTTPKPGYKPY